MHTHMHTHTQTETHSLTQIQTQSNTHTHTHTHSQWDHTQVRVPHNVTLDSECSCQECFGKRTMCLRKTRLSTESLSFRRWRCHPCFLPPTHSPLHMHSSQEVTSCQGAAESSPVLALFHVRSGPNPFHCLFIWPSTDSALRVKPVRKSLQRNGLTGNTSTGRAMVVGNTCSTYWWFVLWKLPV